MLRLTAGLFCSSGTFYLFPVFILFPYFYLITKYDNGSSLLLVWKWFNSLFIVYTRILSHDIDANLGYFWWIKTEVQLFQDRRRMRLMIRKRKWSLKQSQTTVKKLTRVFYIYVVVRKLLPSRAFPVVGKSAGLLNMLIYSKRESGSFNLLPGNHLANRTNHSLAVCSFCK